MFHFWLLPPLQSQVSSWTPAAVLAPGWSRQRPEATFLKMKAPVGASGVMVYCWLALPAVQLWICSLVPFAVPPPARSTHLLVSLVIAMRQLLPSATSVSFCGTPSYEVYCWMQVPTAVDPLQTSTDWPMFVLSAEIR